MWIVMSDKNISAAVHVDNRNSEKESLQDALSDNKSTQNHLMVLIS